MTRGFVVAALGDSGLLLESRREPSADLTRDLIGLSRSAMNLAGVLDAVPGHTSLLLVIQPDKRNEVISDLRHLTTDAHLVEGSLHTVGIHFDGEDVDWICERNGIQREELIRKFLHKPYDVRLIGSPGFVYLSEVDPALTVPRLETPRAMVPAGSVGIGGRQAGIYSLARPGGWRIVGRASEPPPLAPGDRIRFVEA